MSSFSSEPTSEPSANSAIAEVVFELPTVQRMLPLVRRIGDEILTARRRLGELLPGLRALDKRRRHLDWPARRRRYVIQEEVACELARLSDARAELEVLGLLLLRTFDAEIGFPTVVNNRAALFVWRPTEESVQHWKFPGEVMLRPIPVNWVENAELNCTSGH
jgi:hypothetical protein